MSKLNGYKYDSNDVKKWTREDLPDRFRDKDLSNRFDVGVVMSLDIIQTGVDPFLVVEAEKDYIKVVKEDDYER